MSLEFRYFYCNLIEAQITKKEQVSWSQLLGKLEVGRGLSHTDYHATAYKTQNQTNKNPRLSPNDVFLKLLSTD